jgi:hypothetical protein
MSPDDARRPALLYDPAAASVHEQERLARDAMSALERCGDSRGLARAWIVISAVDEMRGRAARQERAAVQILKYGLRGGTYREVAYGRARLAQAILSGPILPLRSSRVGEPYGQPGGPKAHRGRGRPS